MFVCAAVADRQPVIVYRFNGERITSNSSKHTLVTNSTHGTLTVFNVQNSDEGTYSCSASNRQGSVSTSAVLTVQGVFHESVQCVGSMQFLRGMMLIRMSGSSYVLLTSVTLFYFYRSPNTNSFSFCQS